MTILGWNQPIYTFNDFPLFFSVFINIHEYANYANMITCIFDRGMKDIRLSFHLVQILVIYGLKQLRYYWNCIFNPICESHFNVSMNIYEYAN